MMTENIIKIRGCVAAASDLVKKSVESGDQFEQEEIDNLIDKVESLKQKIEEKLKKNNAVKSAIVS
ncbi:MAG: hypothetical protein AAGG68_13845 [Bacteroidota bacterium]